MKKNIDLQVFVITGEILSNQEVGMENQKETIIFTEIEKRVINELDRKDIPNLRFLSSEEVIKIYPVLLDKLLKIERSEFYELLEIPDEDITFEVFEDRNRLSFLFELITHFEMVNSSDATRDIIEEFQPKLVELDDEVSFSKRFYEMHLICRKRLDLTQEQIRILDLGIKNFERSGINLSQEKQDRLKEINQKTTDLNFQFGKNVLDSEKAFEYFFDNDDSIKEMPQDVLENAKELAKNEGKDGYKFTSSISDYINIMKYCTDSQVRKYFFDEARLFGTKGELDNRPIILELLALRLEEANILGFNNYGELSLDTKMAQSPDEVMSQQLKINERAKIKSKKEFDEIKEFFGIDEINIWDLDYYARILKEQKYSLDERVLRQYFKYETVMEGLFNVAKILFDVDLKKIDSEDFGDGAECFEVYKGGELMGYFLADMFYYKEKQSGAWSNMPRSVNYYKGEKILPFVTNTCSFQKLENATLLNYSDVTTMFHEFGHALHSLLSVSKYSQLSGDRVEWDFIELPSQLMENWASGERLKFFATHYETNGIIPDEILASLERLKSFQKGIGVSRYIASSQMDMILHTGLVPKTIEELDALVINIINEISVIHFPENLKPHASFGHVFDGGYAAGYYSYLRAEIIEADIFSEFKKHGIFDKTTAERYLNKILSQGTRKPAIDLFRDFMGREPNIEAYLEKKGL